MDPPGGRAPLNTKSPVTQSRTSPLAPIALAFALLALAVAGYAVGAGMATREIARSGTAGVAELRSRVAAVEATVAAPADSARADSTQAPAARTAPTAATPAAPRTNR